MTISLANANAYFAPGNHVKSDIWIKFSEVHREGAIQTARRMFENELHRMLSEDQTDESLDNREDFAVYEQALWLLLGAPIADASTGDAVSLLVGDSDVQSSQSGKRPRWSDEALRWFDWGGGVTVRC